MLRVVGVVVLLLAGCLEINESTPDCADLGCPSSPAGAPKGDWIPCPDEQEICFCRVSNETTLACTR